MLNNKEIRKLLKANRKLNKFADWLGMSYQGLNKRLNNGHMAYNLYGQYLAFVICEVRNDK